MKNSSVRGDRKVFGEFPRTPRKRGSARGSRGSEKREKGLGYPALINRANRERTRRGGSGVAQGKRRNFPSIKGGGSKACSTRKKKLIAREGGTI